MNDQKLKIWQNAVSKCYKAHIADIDGNLSDKEEKLANLSDEVISTIKIKLQKKIPFGFATARSFRKGDFLNNIINNFSDEEKKYLYLFTEQGTIVLWFDISNAGKAEVKELDLVKHFNIIPNTFSLSEDERVAIFDNLNKKLFNSLEYEPLEYKTSKRYGFLAKIIKNQKNQNFYDEHVLNITKTINKIAKERFLNYEAYCTRSSLFFGVKGANKELSIKYLSDKYKLDIDEIVGTGDRCDELGVDYHLTKHKAGFSTDLYSEATNNPIPLPIYLNCKNKTAWLALDEILTYKK